MIPCAAVHRGGTRSRTLASAKHALRIVSLAIYALGMIMSLPIILIMYAAWWSETGHRLKRRGF